MKSDILIGAPFFPFRLQVYYILVQFSFIDPLVVNKYWLYWDPYCANIALIVNTPNEIKYRLHIDLIPHEHFHPTYYIRTIIKNGLSLVQITNLILFSNLSWWHTKSHWINEILKYVHEVIFHPLKHALFSVFEGFKLCQNLSLAWI